MPSSAPVSELSPSSVNLSLLGEANSRQKKAPRIEGQAPEIISVERCKNRFCVVLLVYSQAEQSGSSSEQALGTGAGVAAGTGDSFGFTALSVPVVVVDFSVDVAASARR